jgi:acetyl esterase/lipase
MKFWSEEIEAMRPEARASVAEAMDSIRTMFGSRQVIDARLNRFERAAAVRDQFPRFQAIPEGTDREIAGVRCRVFLPDDLPATGTYVHVHGGGFVLGCPEMNDTQNLNFSREKRLAVVSVDYRLAPEHPYPAAQDDVFAVTSWVLDHAEAEFGSSRVVIGGESAGASLSVTTLLRLRDARGRASAVSGANLLYGQYDMGDSLSGNGERILDVGDPDFFVECYLPGSTHLQRRAPDISPLFADLSELAPAFMTVGTADHFLDDTLRLAVRWAAAGNELELFVAPEMPHGFGLFRCGITEAWEQTLSDWFDEILSRPEPGVI